MKEVRLGLRKDIVALVDDDMYEEINKYKWRLFNRPHTKAMYAKRKATLQERKQGYPDSVYMHRQIMDIILKPSVVYDHINENGIDNRKENLRIATHSQNIINITKTWKGTSKYKGVSWNAKNSKWIAKLNTDYIGSFNTEEEAAKMYNEKAKELYKEYACLNIITFISLMRY